jgi:hypothetical protein
MHDISTNHPIPEAAVATESKRPVSIIGHLDALETARLVRTHGRLRPEKTDRVVIPACNEEVGIEVTLRYLIDVAGFEPEQIIVLVNNCQDKTETVARQFIGVQVFEQRFVLSNVYGTLERFGFNDLSQINGKGGALFAASLVLNWLGEKQNPRLSGGTRVFFLDADITNIGDIKPIHHLLWGWKQFPHVRMVKLAAQGRSNEGIHATLAIPGNPFADLGCFQWPLCGQMSVLWGDLKQMRLTTGYSVEIAMMADLLKRHRANAALNHRELFAEVGFGMTLCDKWNNEGVHVRMYRNIDALIHALWINHGGASTSELSLSAVIEFNQYARNACQPFWVPSPETRPTQQNKQEVKPLDAILPSVAECL